VSLYNIAAFKAQKMTAEYVVVNQLMANPERDRLVYDLFCSESTSSFDEAWYLMRDFSPKYFVKKYIAYQQTDKRINIQKYFKLFSARFKYENGDEKEAVKDLENIDRTSLADTANEKLFVARLYENLAKAYNDAGDKSRFGLYSNALFEEYPQIVPFAGIPFSMRLSVSGISDAVTTAVTDEIKDCNVNFTEASNSSTADAKIAFIKRGTGYQATITVRSGTGKLIVNNERLIFKNPEGAGKEIALRLFGKGGSLVFEPPPMQEKK
ncbi:MAG TPA: hypothetical protein PLA68_18205, partial [Panacibacter sp.]|nr:hypothetical protein [Panacibacter sp.]